MDPSLSVYVQIYLDMLLFPFPMMQCSSCSSSLCFALQIYCEPTDTQYNAGTKWNQIDPSK